MRETSGEASTSRRSRCSLTLTGRVAQSRRTKRGRPGERALGARTASLRVFVRNFRSRSVMRGCEGTMSSMPEVMDSPLVVADKWVEVQQLDSAQRQAEADLAAMLRVQNLPIAAWRTDRAGLRPC